MSRRRKVYTYTKGQRVHLDTIYDHQGLDGGDWWEALEEDGDELVITRSVRITITATDLRVKP